ncbi:nucleoside/nucleotide kinase family protein [Saccharomonospora piscinae]|uniref:Nucleoside/nucleotide kinase family protein n=1 Tax=Saccharomonospora piscinae TaxID=687388 RepID=A0A1V9A0A4_SACPI|nr:nucleoside/nucleotide kinase family protein [Saccharomonospora piscinae]OQO90575.1 nucleoside/nucleotide kinase family protein [Saccharomonospora piscinae]TLW93244.1 nucleoside/nucleotide kinase family protein [Saccharomonospora piscinae]
MTSFDELLDRAHGLADRDGRTVLGIAGAPAAGKTSLAWRLADALGAQATVIGMDGFHLAQVELHRLGRTDRKGAPDTFDAHGYVHLVRRLAEGDELVYAPEFRREIEEPIAGAVPVPPGVRLVITEGNYLLLDTEPWNELRSLLDEVWFLQPDEDERLERLVTRHRKFGRSLVEAQQRARGSDQRNADLIAHTARRADVVINDMELPRFAV